jgi:hypothetical protein
VRALSLGDGTVAERHEHLARSSRRAEAQLREIESVRAGTMTDREQWAKATEADGYMAVAADAELRRRHPDDKLEPLVSAEPAPLEAADVAQDELPELISTFARKRRAFAGKLVEHYTQPAAAKRDDASLGLSCLLWRTPERDAILQPPKPDIRPSLRVVNRDIELEPAKQRVR